MALSKSRWIAFSLVILASLWSRSFESHAHGQWKYKQIPKTLDSKLEKVALDYNKGANKDSAAGTNAIKECCLAYIARFTVPYDQSLPKFETVRRQLDQFLVEGAPKQPPDARQMLVTTLVQAAGAVAGNAEFSPIARVNCVLILGDLDEARDTVQNTRKPSSAARERLLQLLGADTTPVYLKAVALQGLERHAREPNNGWSDDAKKKVNQAAMQFASAKPAHDSNRQVNCWLTRRSLDLLRTMKSNTAGDLTLSYLSDPEELPGLRFTSLQYLFSQDVKSMTDEQRKAYVLGTAHLLRSELIRWYYSENDRQKRKSGATMGDTGMGAGGLGTGGLGAGGFEDDSGGGRDGGGFDPGGSEFGGGAPGGGRGSGGRGSGRKPIDTQTWEARLARRQLNQLLQYVRFALEGKRVKTDTVRTISHLSVSEAGLADEYNLPRLIELIDGLQSKVNDNDRITTVQSLMTQSKKEIETTMRFIKGLPGFLDKYPELRGGDEELQAVEEPTDDDSSDTPESPAGDGGNADGGGNAGDGGNADGGKPGTGGDAGTGGNAGGGDQPPGNN